MLDILVVCLLSVLLLVCTGLICGFALRLRLMKSIRSKFFLFALLWLAGILLYCELPKPKDQILESQGIREWCQKILNCHAPNHPEIFKKVSNAALHESKVVLSAANRVTSAFFPSRGGYESVEDEIEIRHDNRGVWRHLVYYFFHYCVLIYVALLVFSIFGRHFIDKVCRFWMRRRIRFLLDNRMRMCVFWGDPEPARLLANNLRSKRGRKELGYKPKILFLLPGWLCYDGTARASIFRLSDKGYVLDFIDGLPSDDDKYNVVGKEFELKDEDVAGRRHFLLSENSAYNIGLANAIIGRRKDKYRNEKLDLYIRVENSAASGVLKDWADATMNDTDVKSNIDLDIHIFRETEIMAENFIKMYPILKHWKSDGTETVGWLLEGTGDCGVVRLRDGVGRLCTDDNTKMGLAVLIVGFGSRGQELLNKMLENSQFLGAGDAVIPIRFVVLDKWALKWKKEGEKEGLEWCCRAKEVYQRHSPEIVEPLEGSGFKVEFKEITGDVAENGFDDLGITVSDYDRIVVCTGNDELNVRIGDIARREFIAQGVKLEKGRLFVQLQSEGVKNREEVKERPIEYFGMWNEIFTYDGIVDEDKYYGAQLLNWRYNYGWRNKDGNEVGPSNKSRWEENEEGVKKEIDTVANKWRGTEWFDKESSIASYYGMLNIVALMGCRIAQCDAPRCDAGQDFGKECTAPKTWERLSIDEHLRWMTFLRTHGVSRWDLKNPSLNQIKACKVANGENESEVVVKAKVRKEIGGHAALVDYGALPSIDLQLAQYNNGRNYNVEEFEGIKGESANVRDSRVNDGEERYKENLQWNDMKFVKWIPTLFSQLWETRKHPPKIVKVEKDNASA